MQDCDYSKSRNERTQTQISNSKSNRYRVVDAATMTKEELIEAIRQKIRKL